MLTYLYAKYSFCATYKVNGILLNKRKKAEGTNTYDEATAQVSDMLGRLVVFEEMFSNKKQKKLK